ncbi:MAG: (d)CMP kinase [Treponema sp.]|jgi:cytidylate kinase|nr:(d)CMP kinase [Treponema sp.]MBQ1591447.1 (d)CMP kinase [Treponema sp.]MBQ1644550.1 (d)CMP kinase [Treponema sp.]MBQ1672202.1 (d)CMP kinase [Treponema sp.]MBQ1713692.1 (d)CMP kinase [Treponema sp.]
MVVAIDGPAGTGKSTVAHQVAKDLGLVYLNSGSFYRALTLSAIEAGISPDDADAVLEHAKKQKLDYVNARLILNGVDVDDQLHQDKVDSAVSKVSSIVELRHLVNARMREIVQDLSIICEGRDMTTVVFPNAEHKFFLDASIDVQAKRRFDQGVSDLTLEEIKAAIIKRDEMDRKKAEGSLKKSADSFYIDTSDLTISQVCEIIESKINA